MMQSIALTLQLAIPSIGLILLITGVKKKRTLLMIGAFWLCAITLFLHHKAASYHLLGDYFDYKHTTAYSFSLLVLLASLLYLYLKQHAQENLFSRCLSLGLTASVCSIGIVLVLNLWINAYFVETTLEGTNVVRTDIRSEQPRCSHRFVLYRVGLDGNISLLCPNHYAVFPKIVRLQRAPEAVISKLGAVDV